MKPRPRKIQSGFTLVEVLVYIAVLVMVTLASVLTFLSFQDVIVRNTVAREMNDAAASSLERLVREARTSEAVDTINSDFVSTPNDFYLDQGATTTRFFVSGSRLHIEVNGVDLGPLTNDSVTVDSFLVTNYPETANGTEMVRIELTLTHTSAVYPDTRTYYASAVLRNSYE